MFIYYRRIFFSCRITSHNVNRFFYKINFLGNCVIESSDYYLDFCICQNFNIIFRTLTIIAIDFLRRIQI